MVTVKSIAENLGLSSATVSRALRGDETLSIAAETRMRILMTAEQMGYKKKAAKPSVMAGAGKRIVVLHRKQTFRHQIDSSYYFAVRTGIEDACQKNAFQCIFIDIETLGGFSEKMDGALIVGNYTQQQYTEILRAVGSVPITAIGVVAYYPETIDHVTHNNRDSVRLALEHLYANGHKEIGYLGIQEAEGTERFGSRKSYFEKYMRAKGVYQAQWLHESGHGADRVEQGYNMMKSWLEKKTPLPTAIFCANDPIALGAVKALLESGVRVPEDISIVAHDGSYPTQYSFPALTTVDVHPYAQGAEGVALLCERLLMERKIPKKVLLFPELIVRDSVRKL